MICPAASHEVEPFKAAHWQCPSCNEIVVACFVCYPAGAAYEYVDDARRGHRCAPPRVVRNTSTPEGKAFWDNAAKSADGVRDWPDWKKAGVNAGQPGVAVEAAIARDKALGKTDVKGDVGQ